METFAVGWYRALLASTFGVIALCLGGALAAAVPWLALLLAAPPAWIAVRAARCGLRLSPSGVEVRGVFRTRRAEWDRVRDVRIGSGSSTGLPWRIPVFVLEDGELRAEEVRSLREDAVADRAIDCARSFLSSN